MISFVLEDICSYFTLKFSDTFLCICLYRIRVVNGIRIRDSATGTVAVAGKLGPLWYLVSDFGIKYRSWPSLCIDGKSTLLLQLCGGRITAEGGWCLLSKKRNHVFTSTADTPCRSYPVSQTQTAATHGHLQGVLNSDDARVGVPPSALSLMWLPCHRKQEVGMSWVTAQAHTINYF